MPAADADPVSDLDGRGRLDHTNTDPVKKMCNLAGGFTGSLRRGRLLGNRFLDGPLNRFPGRLPGYFLLNRSFFPRDIFSPGRSLLTRRGLGCLGFLGFLDRLFSGDDLLLDQPFFLR